MGFARPRERDALQTALNRSTARVAAGPSAVDFVNTVAAMVDMEARRLRHDPSELISRAVQPALWLLLFGQVFSRLHGIPTGSMRYIDFMAPGILAQSALFVSIFYGISIIWERDVGALVKFLASPAPRSAIVLGKALSASVRGVLQMFIIYTLAAATGVRLNMNPANLLGVVVLVVLGSALFACFSMMIACVVKTQQRMLGIGQLLTMPLFFASNAIYPITLMPTWLQVVSRCNPLSYEVDGLRALMPLGGATRFGMGLDFTVLIAVTAVLVVICSRLYGNIVR